jgi:Na+/H+ antiporter NhaD/arsenite permease-like protein
MTVQIGLAVAVFVGAYILIATEKVSRVTVALVGAALMIVIGATDGDAIFFSQEAGIDWNVIFLLLGMMMIVGVLQQTGVFEYLAIWAAKRARGRPFVIMVMLVVITAVLSAALDNVTTVLLIAPVTLLICDRLAVTPVPFLIAEVMASNIGGTATLIGDPPNIIIASRSGLSFNDFLVNMGPIVLILLAVFIGLCWLMFRKQLHYDESRVERVMALNEREAIRDVALLVTSLIVLALVLAGFVLHSLIHMEPAVVALLGAGLLVLITKLETRKVFADVEWETLLFFVGLFIMVGSLVNLGLIEKVGHAATEAVGSHYLGAAAVLLGGSAVFSGVVDNIPYVTTMAPLTADLVLEGGAVAKPLWWALALGADLGGNATAIGASANVVVLGIARRNGHPISFWQFTKYGIVVTAVTVAISLPYLWLRYFAG